MRKKFLSGALVLATAAVVAVAGASVDASAANTALTETTVKVDSVNQTLTVNATGCKEVGFSVATVNKTGIIKSAADSAWEWHDVTAGKEVAIDLSSLSNTKDNFVQLKTDTAEELTIKIPAVNTKVKAVYDAFANKVTVLDTTASKTGVAVTDAVEFKNKYGNWAEYTDSALSSYVYKGAALTFRISAKADKAIVAKGEKDAKIEYQISKTEKVEVPYFVANSFPGKEVKVSVKKLANGPKIAANYVKNTITVPKGAEYRITSEGDTALGAWTQLKDVTKAEALDAVEKAEKAGTIEVRTKAVAAEGTKAGKPASKISRLNYKAVETVKMGTTDESVKDFADNKKVKGDIALAYVGTADDKGITVEYTKDAKGNATGIEITNNTLDAYQIYVDKEGKLETVPDGTVKATSLGAATTKNDKVTPKKIKIAKCDKAQIFVRKAGNAKAATWATAYIGLGTVKYPEAPAPSEAPTAEPTADPAA